jgi:acetyl esterase
MVDPDIQRLLDTIFKAAPVTPAPDVRELRAAADEAPRRLGGVHEELASVRDVDAPGPAGPIPLRVYKPEGDGALPLLLYAHGGGWVTGSLDSHDKLCRILAKRVRAVVVAVGYRCAPEHVYPAALDDVEAAWRWVRSHASAVGADGARFAVGGDSSGGNLAAALTLRLRETGETQPDLQLLLYPALDSRCSRASYRDFSTGFNLSAAQMTWYWDAYRAKSGHDAPELSPLAAPSLAGLAPAVIAVAENDVLRDDAIDYARRLAGDGAAVTVVRCDGMIHGFLRWTGVVPAAIRWIDRIAEASSELLKSGR